MILTAINWLSRFAIWGILASLLLSSFTGADSPYSRLVLLTSLLVGAGIATLITGYDQ